MLTYIEKQLEELKYLAESNNHSSIPKQLTLVKEISKDMIHGPDLLLQFLLNRKTQSNWSSNCVDGLIYEILKQEVSSKIQNKLTQAFKVGVVHLNSEKNIDYSQLQNLLVNKRFQEADQLTQYKLCELSDLQNNQRSWLYFTDILFLPTTDLLTIDNLWRVHSQNKFGFSIQRQIWLANNKNWNKLWNNIGWTTNNILRRYPNEFQWNINSPTGHLPLFNQLRGVQVLYVLFQHKAWEKPYNKTIQF